MCLRHLRRHPLRHPRRLTSAVVPSTPRDRSFTTPSAQVSSTSPPARPQGDSSIVEVLLDQQKLMLDREERLQANMEASMHEQVEKIRRELTTCKVITDGQLASMASSALKHCLSAWSATAVR